MKVNNNLQNVIKKIKTFIHQNNKVEVANLFKTIFSGYLRGIPYEELKDLFTMVLNGNKFSEDDIEIQFIRRMVVLCFIEYPCSKDLPVIVKQCIALLSDKDYISSHKLIAAILNKLFDKCRLTTQVEILNFFLDSSKKSLRKYAYRKKLNLFPEKENILKKAFVRISEYPDEAIHLLSTIVTSYDKSYIENNFQAIINHPEINSCLIKKIFMRKQSIQKSDWIWLKSYSPQNVLYLAAMRTYDLTDNECEQYARALFHDLSDICDIRFVYWSLAKLNKLDIIPKIYNYTKQNNHSTLL